MTYFLIGVAILLLSLYVGRAFLRVDPRNLSVRLRKAAGVAVLAIAVLLLVRGALVAAIPLGFLGFSLLGLLPSGFGPLGNTTKTAGQQSRVRTRFIEMLLDHDSGRMDGRVLTGQFAGKTLSSLALTELLALWSETRRSDTQSQRLLEAYLDHNAPDWRAAAGAGARRDDDRGGQKSGGPMSPEEAYDVLGLSAGASAAEVRRAHRELMKKMHPDRGGSTYLAAKINQAKDVLLRAKR